jgi:hypothetical protein
MRFEVRYPAGEPHEVELQGTFAVLGRDPSCDLVLNDVKCSRRHAVIEAGPEGLAIRDTDSANGIFVNGQKIERAKLHEGDLVRLGEIVLRVLPEQITGTVVMGPEDLVDLAPSPAPVAAPPVAPPLPPRRPVPPTAPLTPPPRVVAPRPSPPAAPRPPAPARPSAPPSAGATPGRALPPRPLTVQVLAALWIAAGLLYLASGAFLAARGDLPSPFGIVSAVAGLLFAVFGGVMAFGLWTLRPWARILQIGVAAVGVLNCPMTLASATVLVYMLRKPAALWFSHREQGRASREEGGAIDQSTETTFALTILAMVVLGVLLSAGGLYLAYRQS